MFNIEHHTLYHTLYQSLARNKPSAAQNKLSRFESDQAQLVFFNHDNLELRRGEGDFVIIKKPGNKHKTYFLGKPGLFLF